MSVAGQPVEAQVDTPAAREARATIRELRRLYGTQPTWSDWSRHLQLEDVEYELQAGDRAEARVFETAAQQLSNASVFPLRDKSFQRLATALSTCAAELAPVPADQWPADCRQQAQNYVPVTPELIAQARQAYQERMNKLERILSSLGSQERAWREFLFWSESRDLATSVSVAPAVLDHLETRWCNALGVWNLPELVETSLAARSYIRLLRGYLEHESPEQHASAWNELAGLLAAREQTADPDLSQIAAAVAQRERLHQASCLTASIRRELSHPNFILKVRTPWLQSQFAQKVDEPYQVNGTFAGASTTGAGRLLGSITCEVRPSNAVGQGIMRFEGTANAATIGVGDRVRVQSHATTRIHSEKPFTFDARGLNSRPASVTASTTIEYDDVSVGGSPLRRNRATQQTYARRGQAEVDSAALARQSFGAQMDKQGEALGAQVNRFYGTNIRDRLIHAHCSIAEARVRAGEDALRFECRIERSASSASSAPPEFDVDADAVVCVTASALEELAVAALGSRQLTGEQLSQVLGEFLGKSTRAGPSDQDFRVAFAEDPCDLDFADGRIRVSFHVTSFESGDVRYPPMIVDAQYKLEPREGGLALLRQGALGTRPLGKDEGDERAASGRRQTLQVAVRRKLNKVLAEELLWRRLATPGEGNAGPSLRVERVLVDGGWLQIALASEGTKDGSRRIPVLHPVRVGESPLAVGQLPNR